MKEFRTLRADEIECRISQIKENWCTLLLYKNARVDMDILDETFGCLNWKREHKRDNANCVVSIYNVETKEWVSKEDTGTESFSEAEKGLASDSFKRACVNWGIGRELYSAPSIFIFPRKDMVKRGQQKEFFTTEKGKVTTKTRFHVELIDYDENRKIKDLIIRDDKNNIRFTQLTKETEKKIFKVATDMRNLLNELEMKDENFDREAFYKFYNVTSDAQLTYKQQEKAIELLKERLKK